MNKTKIFKFICLFLYIACVGVLIFEASLDGGASSNQSNTVGGGIANVFNDINGDATKKIAPTKVEITNTIASYHPHDSVKLSYKTTPENATYQSYSYSSSDSKIASIDNDGNIQFLAEGSATISITNTHPDFKNITDSITFTVTNILAEDIDIELYRADTGSTIESVDSIYQLYVGLSYAINAKIFPENTTNKAISFSTNSDLIKLSNDGIITPLKKSDSAIEIIVTADNITKTIKIMSVVEEIPVINLESIAFSSTPARLTKTQSYQPKLIFTPANATNKGYKLVSSNSSAISISGKTIKAIGVSDTLITITAISLADENITASFNVYVDPQPEITEYTASLKTPIFVGKSTTISISGIKPSLADTSSKKFEIIDSNNLNSYNILNSSSIISLDKKTGKITGKEPGTAYILVSINNINKILTLVVEEEPLDNTSKLEIEYDNTAIFYTDNKEICLDDYISSVRFLDEEGKPANTLSTSLSYSINQDYGVIVKKNNKSYLSPKECGVFTITAIHSSSGTEAHFDIIIIDPFDISINNEIYNGTELKLNVDSTLEFHINKSQANNNHCYTNYKIEYNNEILSLGTSNDSYILTALNSGIASVKIIPIIQTNNTSYELTKAAKTINISTSHIFASEINPIVEITNHKGEEKTLDISSGTINMYLNDKLSISAISNNATILQFDYSTNDTQVLHVANNGNVKPKRTGNATIIIQEVFSGIKYELAVKVINLIELKENPITIKATNVKHDAESNTFSITNGYSGNITINFKEHSTFKNASYTVENEKILTIGKDGVITPLKAGSTNISVIINDDNNDPIELELTIKVVRQEAIKDIASFLYKVRKGLGHFGAFFVLGIFSTLTLLLFFTKFHWIWSVPLNIAQGFGVAALTEFIQLYVPGRSGNMSDVLLDFSGFIISAILITIFILLKAFIEFLKAKKTNNN